MSPMADQSIVLLSISMISILITGAVASLASSADYPLELCLERTYWRPLPKPEGVLGYGYNAIRGPVSTMMFNVSSYEGIRPCRLTIKTKPDGRMVVEGYRLPGYVEEYWFNDDGDASDGDDRDRGGEVIEEDADNLNQLRFTLITYESSAHAFMDMRSRWGIMMNKDSDYESLFFTLNSPVRYYGGHRFRDTVHTTVREQAAAAPFYTLRVETIAGRFSMKPYRFAHFVRGFVQRLRDLVRKNGLEDEEATASFFDTFGTHFPIAGNFGGVDERRVSFEDYFDARCHKSSKITIDMLATCDGLKLKYQYGFPNVRVFLKLQPGEIDSAKPIDLEAAKNESLETCRTDVDYISRSTSYVASAGGKLSTRLALHPPRRFPSDFSNIAAWRKWVEAVPAEPATVKVRMAPICELIPIVDRRPDAKSGCQNRLLDYLRRRDHFLMADHEACDISAGKMPIGFESASPDFWDNLLQLQSNHSVITYCVPTSSFDRINPCPMANQQAPSYSRGRKPYGRYRKPGTGAAAANVAIVWLVMLPPILLMI